MFSALSLYLLLQISFFAVQSFVALPSDRIITRNLITVRSTLQDYPLTASVNVANNVNKLTDSTKSEPLALSGLYSLHEVIEDDEVVTSLITFADSGEIYFVETSQRADLQSISGSWIIVNNALRMVVDRTFKGRYSSCTIRSRYQSFLEEPGQGIKTIAGEIYDETMVGSDRVPSGQFMISQWLGGDDNQHHQTLSS